MAILHVRGIPEPLYKRAQRIAEAQGKSLSQVVIEALERIDAEDVARRRHIAAMAEIRANLAQRPALPAGVTVPSVLGEVRDESTSRLIHE